MSPLNFNHTDSIFNEDDLDQSVSTQITQPVFGHHSKKKFGNKLFKNNKGQFSGKQAKLFFGGAFLLFLVVALGAGYYLTQLNQEIRQQAAVTAYPGTCYPTSCPAHLMPATSGECYPSCGGGTVCCKPTGANCSNLQGPTSLTVGETGTYSANFFSVDGDLRGRIGINDFTIIADQTSAGTNLTVSGTWTPTQAGEYLVSCRSWRDGIAECRYADHVDGPPRYACEGPNNYMTVTVSDVEVRNWNMQVSATCPDGSQFPLETKASFALWPPNPLSWSYQDILGSGIVSIASSNSSNNGYLSLKYNGEALETKADPCPHPSMDCGSKFFNPLTPMYRWSRNVPSGTYSLEFLATQDMCNDAVIACEAASDCNDNNECTNDICLNPGTYDSSCSNPAKSDGTVCAEGTCQGGACENTKTFLKLITTFDGVPYCEGENCHHPIESHPLFVDGYGRVMANVVLLHAKAGSFERNNVNFIYNAEYGNFSTVNPIELENLPAGPYMVFVKGPMHLATRFCYFGNKASEHCIFEDLVRVNNEYPVREVGFIYLDPGEIIVDLSKKPLIVGDLPISGPSQNIQDGKVNIFDYSFMLSCLGNGSRSDSCLTRADVDYSGQVNNIDLGLLRKTLTEVADEL